MIFVLDDPYTTQCDLNVKSFQDFSLSAVNMVRTLS